MAQRFGGKYSPSGNSQPTPPTGDGMVTTRRVDAAGAKSNVLFVPPVVLMATSLTGGAAALALAVAGSAVLLLAAWLLRDGLRAEAAYAERAIARRPAMPRKIAATVLTGLGVAIAAFAHHGNAFAAVLFGLVAAVLHSVAFGIDPLTDKRMEGVDTFQQDRVARVVDEAEQYLGATRDHIAALNDRPLEIRVESFIAAARKMIRTVEEDPRDLTAARQYLVVYLMGARDASVKFADLYRRGHDPKARSDYESLLTDLETNFAARTAAMMKDDRTDLDIEIKVLRDRLQREGVKPE